MLLKACLIFVRASDNFIQIDSIAAKSIGLVL